MRRKETIDASILKLQPNGADELGGYMEVHHSEVWLLLTWMHANYVLRFLVLRSSTGTLPSSYVPPKLAEFLCCQLAPTSLVSIDVASLPEDILILAPVTAQKSLMRFDGIDPTATIAVST